MTALQKSDGQTGHTPGPWAWFGNARMNEIYLATTHSGRRYVMGFKRWGFSGAQPMFQPAERGLVPAEQLVTFEVGDRDVVGVEAAKANNSVYRFDIRGVDCADARLIAAAPELLEAAERALNYIASTEAEMGETMQCGDLLRSAISKATGASS